MKYVALIASALLVDYFGSPLLKITLALALFVAWLILTWWDAQKFRSRQ